MRRRILRWVPKIKPLQTLPNEIITEILLKSDLADIPNLCLSSSIFNDICRSEAFWRFRAIQNFGILPNEFNDIDALTAKDKYMKILYYIGNYMDNIPQLYLSSSMIGLLSIITNLDQRYSKDGFHIVNNSKIHNFSMNYLLPDESRFEYLYANSDRFYDDDDLNYKNIHIANYALYLAYVYNQSRVFNYLLENFRQQLLLETQILCHTITKIDDTVSKFMYNFRHSYHVLVTSVSAGNPIYYQMLTDYKYRDIVNEINNYLRGDALTLHSFANDINTVETLIGLGINILEEMPDPIARVVDGVSWRALVSKYNLYLEVNSHQSFIQAVIYGNYDLVVYLRSCVNLAPVYLLDRLSIFFGENLNRYGKDYSLRTNIYNGINLYYNNNPPESIVLFLQLIKTDIPDEYMRLFQFLLESPGDYFMRSKIINNIRKKNYHQYYEKIAWPIYRKLLQLMGRPSTDFD